MQVTISRGDTHGVSLLSAIKALSFVITQCRGATEQRGCDAGPFSTRRASVAEMSRVSPCVAHLGHLRLTQHYKRSNRADRWGSRMEGHVKRVMVWHTNATLGLNLPCHTFSFHDSGPFIHETMNKASRHHHRGHRTS